MELLEVLEKPYTESDRIEFIVGNNHNKGYEIRETETQLQAWGLDAHDKLLQAKESKIALNDELRDSTLLGGVTYQNVLFDSDTDQKVNLLATVSTMPDDMTITWFGMDNTALLCTKADLIAIGSLITELHSFCWQNNAYIKEQIQNAETIEELDGIEVSYARDDT